MNYTVKNKPAILEKAIQAAFREYAPANLQESDLAASMICFESGENLVTDFRGDQIFPSASVIKLFYLVAAFHWLNNGKLELSAEFSRALQDMIIDSSNDATSYIIDLLTGTTSGPELDPDVMKDWEYKRNAVNRFFSDLNYKGINVNQKTWGDGPYGRERIFVGANYENRNRLTTNLTARLFTDIIQEQVINPAACKNMLNLLKRDPGKSSTDPDNQDTKFIGRALPAGSLLWSKAGWTSTVRHDAAYVQLPNGKRFVLVIFTMNHSSEHGIIPFIAGEIISALSAT